MLLVGSMLVYAAFVRIVIWTERPLPCAVAYSLTLVAAGGLFGATWTAVLVGAVIDFLYAWGWFELLVRTFGSWLFWGALLGGLALPFFARIALQTVLG
ncbi:MAG: hypothetical protein IPJ77_00925 [Planctomycetes bacterium]|nr:hypothetical protein [Planctomycetota bacterium]